MPINVLPKVTEASWCVYIRNSLHVVASAGCATWQYFMNLKNDSRERFLAVMNGYFEPPNRPLDEFKYSNTLVLSVFVKYLWTNKMDTLGSLEQNSYTDRWLVRVLVTSDSEIVAHLGKWSTVWHGWLGRSLLILFLPNAPSLGGVRLSSGVVHAPSN
jgi:hypothetical protein